MLDVRKAAATKAKSIKDFSSLKLQIKEELASALVNGNIFVVNLDDSSTKWDENVDPILSEIVGADYLPINFLNYKYLMRPECYNRILAGTESEGSSVSEDFLMIIWSKFSVSDSTEYKKILEQVEKRFALSLPFTMLDMVIVTSDLHKLTENNENPKI